MAVTNIRPAFDRGIPGVSTTLTQTVDISAFNPRIYKELLAASRAGVVKGTGQATRMATFIAEHYGLSPPVNVLYGVFRSGNRATVRFGSHTEQIEPAILKHMGDLALVRHKMQAAAGQVKPLGPTSMPYIAGNKTLGFLWYPNAASFVDALSDFLKTLPWFEDMRRLEAILLEKPTITVTRNL